MNRRIDTLTGAELLRADTLSQKVFLEEVSGARGHDLIEAAQFWGDGKNSGLYYHYLDDNNVGWTVEKNGWNDYSQDSAVKMSPKQTEDWLRRKTFRNSSSLTVIQGYAGCGKTVFINNFLHSLNSNRTSDKTDVYVDYDGDLTEDGYLVNTLRNKLAQFFVSFITTDEGNEIFKKFYSLLCQYKNISPSFNDLVVLFDERGYLAKYLILLYENRNNTEEIEKLKEQFEMQFLCATKALSTRSKRIYWKQNPRLDSLSNIDEICMQQLLEYYLVLHLLLLCATNTTNNNQPIIVTYDNLDIIDNPMHIADLIRTLQEILYKINTAFHNNGNYVFNVILAVRKVTHNKIANKMNEVEPEGRGGFIPASFLDISNLYSATRIIKHKATVYSKNLDDYFPALETRKKFQDFLDSILSIPDEVLNEISLSDLFNHNIRACANILDYSINNSVKNDISLELAKTLPVSCSSMIWLNNICAVLQESEIWNSLGFDSSISDDSEKVCFPASYSRLILTYLYNKRRDYRNHITGAADVEASLKDIIELLADFPIINCRKNLDREQKKKLAKKHSNEESRIEIINAIAQMLERNKHAVGMIPEYEQELWRRPIYYTRHTFPLIDKKGRPLAREELKKQLPHLHEANANITSFCITDEGYTFIEKIVTSFEFFSVRVNGNEAKPLCTITDSKVLDRIIGKVHSFVEKTAEDHVWLIKHRIGINDEDMRSLSFKDKSTAIDKYMNIPVHPKTDGNHPQLHIVRTIFDHINALNIYRDYLISSNPKNLDELNEKIVLWIGKYLSLYQTHFYYLLRNTSGAYNEVFLDLKYLYWIVGNAKDLLPKDINNKSFISITRDELKTKKVPPRRSIIHPDKLLKYWLKKI